MAGRDATLIVNPGAGGSNASQQTEGLIATLRKCGLNAEPMSTGTLDPGEAARTALRRGSTTLIAAGGDGTVSAVAAAVVDAGAVLGVLPVGTLNHFAKDLHIPLDIEEAARVIAAGKVKRVDVAEVNGRVFINNSSLGVYPHMVMFREEHLKKGLGKWGALFRAAVAVLRRVPFLQVRLSTGNAEISRLTPLVFVGNNDYALTGLDAGTRENLDAGTLCVYIMNVGSGVELVKVSLRALLGRAADNLDALCTDEVSVETKRRVVRLSTDGEVSLMETPLHYRIRPAALRVLAP